MLPSSLISPNSLSTVAVEPFASHVGRTPLTKPPAARMAAPAAWVLVKSAVIWLLPRFTAVSATVSWFAFESITSCSPTNMPRAELTPRVAVTMVSTGTFTAPVSVAVSVGSEILPAWPISCCSSSVALRTAACICVLLSTLKFVMDILASPCVITVETMSRMVTATSSSSREKPRCQPFRICGNRCRCMIIFPLGLRIRHDAGHGRLRSEPASAANTGNAPPDLGRYRDQLHRRADGTKGRRTGDVRDVPDAYVKPVCGRGNSDRQGIAVKVQIIDVVGCRSVRIGTATHGQPASARRGSRESCGVRERIGIRQADELLHLVLRVFGSARHEVTLVFRRGHGNGAKPHDSRGRYEK